jgi:ubiquinone/menaquinone biosynthesis C-methylase UbiE/uncharacterized protein YbaR (Trm112 family)
MPDDAAADVANGRPTEPVSNPWADHIDLLRCPISGLPLSLLSETDQRLVNSEINALARLCRNGAPVRDLVSLPALGSPDLRYIYRIERDIPCLIGALALVRPDDVDRSTIDRNMESVKQFYDEFGWLDAGAGNTNDAVAFTATTAAASVYAVGVTKRIGAKLYGGRYLLDAASGFVAPVLVDLSSKFEYRVCVDFSILALRRTKDRLGRHALCILGDLTSLPVASGSVDQAMSLHTLYHIPPEHQTRAVDELVRVTKPRGSVIAVYSWANAPLMNAILSMTVLLGGLRRRVTTARDVERVDPAVPLYFRPRGREWLAELRQKYKVGLRVASATNAQFQNAFFKDTPFGRFMVPLILTLETLFEPVTARFGQYPMFVISTAPTRHLSEAAI